MKIKHLLLSVLTLGIFSCRLANKSEVPEARDTSEEENIYLQQDIKGNVVRTDLVDSSKWILYTFNYDSKAISEETRDTISPLSCELKLTEVSRNGQDTVEYYFNVFFKNERYLFFPTDHIGVGAIKDSIRYLIGSHTISDPIPRRVFLSKDALFIQFLKKYQGETNTWLKKEATKRKIFEL